MSEAGSSYTLSTTADLPFADSVACSAEELAAEGSRVLCEIDMQAIVQAKLGVDRDPYLILVACNSA
jgi:uncharacterized protein (DUF302 family)